MKKLGRPASVNKLVSVTIRLHPDMMNKYKATGPGWVTRIRKDLETLHNRS